MKYARIFGGVVREVWDQRPVLHPGIEIAEVGGAVLAGWIVDGDGDIVPPDKPETFETWDKAAGAYVVDASARDAARQEAIKIELASLDAAAVRPARAVLAAQLAGVAPDAADTARLAEIEARARTLRTELATLDL
ncbi:hypothetical protein [Paucidesulfovibrio longus]|uniref:hypothetical protein n=1 Tax=Paucidesulfovibrio longus TaxID=889 RepID=UPI0003B4C7CE|nr:hypothetical protein [Paucidesulfovibrio longus]